MALLLLFTLHNNDLCIALRLLSKFAQLGLAFIWWICLGARACFAEMLRRKRVRSHLLRSLFWFCHFWLDIRSENNNKSTQLSIFICYLAFFDEFCLNLSYKIHRLLRQKRSHVSMNGGIWLVLNSVKNHEITSCCSSTLSGGDPQRPLATL